MQWIRQVSYPGSEKFVGDKWRNLENLTKLLTHKTFKPINVSPLCKFLYLATFDNVYLKNKIKTQTTATSRCRYQELNIWSNQIPFSYGGIIVLYNSLVSHLRLHCVKCVPVRSFFWSMFSCIRTEYGDLLHKSPYSVRIQENTDQKKLRIWPLFTQCCT